MGITADQNLFFGNVDQYGIAAVGTVAMLEYAGDLSEIDGHGFAESDICASDPDFRRIFILGVNIVIAELNILPGG